MIRVKNCAVWVLVVGRWAGPCHVVCVVGATVASGIVVVRVIAMVIVPVPLSLLIMLRWTLGHNPKHQRVNDAKDLMLVFSLLLHVSPSVYVSILCFIVRY